MKGISKIAIHKGRKRDLESYRTLTFFRKKIEFPEEKFKESPSKRSQYE